MRELWALTASTTAFATSYRDSNCIVKADDHRNGGTIKIKTVEIRIKISLKPVLPVTMASNSTSHAQTALASSSAK